MNRKMWLALLGISAFACNFLFPQNSSVSEGPTTVVSEVTSEIPTAFDTQPSTADIFISYDDLTIVRLHPNDGDLQTMLAVEAQYATTLGLSPVVEFDATWCPPCQAIDAALKSQNELMVNAYRGMYIIKLDVDEWGWKDSIVEDFYFEFIPVYFKIDSNGIQTGEEINGGAWAEDIPENIAPVMDEFFHNN